MPITIQITHEISDQDIKDLMSSAIDSGIGYWCPGTKIVTHGENEEQQEFPSEQLGETLVKGGTIAFAEDEEEAGDPKKYVWHEMTLDTLTKGFQKYFLRQNASTDSGDWDSEHSDVIVQLAIFGEIIYG